MGGLLTVIVGECEFERVVVPEFVERLAAYLALFGKTLPSEERQGATVLELDPCLHGTERDLALPVGCDAHRVGVE